MSFPVSNRSLFADESVLLVVSIDDSEDPTKGPYASIGFRSSSTYCLDTSCTSTSSY